MSRLAANTTYIMLEETAIHSIAVVAFKPSNNWVVKDMISD